jgi:xylan alpha-glucuronosyltransferase
MFRADPPQLYTIHYFGLNPWMCYRDFEAVRSCANDEVHWRWWRLYDGTDHGLRKMCRLSAQQKSKLKLFRNQAAKMQYNDEHLKINITDPRKDQ